MPRGIPKSGKRNCKRRAAHVTLTCEHCRSAFQLTESHYRVRIKTCPVRYCTRACYFAAIKRPPSPPKPKRVPQFDQRAYMREYHPKWRAANKERVAAQQRLSRARLREKRRNEVRQRRAVMARGATTNDIMFIMAAASGRCTYCGLPVPKLELDHVSPIKKGGDHKSDNLLPCCRSCNASKGTRDLADWLFDRFGVDGLARAVVMLEQRKLVEALYPGTEIVEVRGA